MAFNFVKVGSIRLILDSLDLMKEENDFQKTVGFTTIPVKHVRSGSKSIRKFFRGSDFVRHLIPNNIKEVEFIYKVNFDAGKGEIGGYPLSFGI